MTYATVIYIYLLLKIVELVALRLQLTNNLVQVALEFHLFANGPIKSGVTHF